MPGARPIGLHVTFDVIICFALMSELLIGPHTNSTGSHMRIFLPLTISSILFLSACSRAPQEMVAVPPPAPEASSTNNYACQSGATITATYPSTDSAMVKYKARTYDMKIAVSASGARYVSEDLEWWTKGSGVGSEASLFRHMPDGTSGEIIETCTRS